VVCNYIQLHLKVPKVPTIVFTSSSLLVNQKGAATFQGQILYQEDEVCASLSWKDMNRDAIMPPEQVNAFTFLPILIPLLCQILYASPTAGYRDALFRHV